MARFSGLGPPECGHHQPTDQPLQGCIVEHMWENLGWVLFVVFVFGGWVINSVVSSFTNNWRQVRQSEQLAALKQTMVERGLSAEDIERIMNAGSEEAAAAQAKKPANQSA